MSDGMRDASILGKFETRLEVAAWELRKAIDQAVGGHRGIAIDVPEIVNTALERTNYRLVVKS